MSDQSEQTRAIESDAWAAQAMLADQAVPASQAGTGREAGPADDTGSARPSRRRFGRRLLMLGAAATGAGVAASLTSGAAADAAPDGSTAGSTAVKLGQYNTAHATTQVTTRSGSGLVGQTFAAGQSGVVGFDTSTASDAHGVYGRSIHGFGVLGISEHSSGVVGQTSTAGAAGVSGIDLAPIVGARGLFGQSHVGDALYATSANGNAVHAWSSNGNALLVEGRAKFGYSGVANVPSGQQSVTVSRQGVTPSDIVLATIQKPQHGIYVEGAEAGTNSFTITLSGKPSGSLPIGWIILG
jgi:hypothetical protein